MDQILRRPDLGIRDVWVGDNHSIVLPVNLYECRLGKDVLIGPFVEVQKGVTVGDGTHISSHSFLCSGVSIGENTFIGHSVMFTNDDFVTHYDKENPKKTKVGNNVKIGSGSVILPGANICDGTIIGAGSVVTKAITEPGIYYGNPARRKDVTD